MHFSSTSGSLTAPLQQLAALAPSRLGADALMAQMKIKADSEGLKLTATDGELELSARVVEGVTVSQEGEAYVPARQMATFYASLKADDDVAVQTSDGATELRASSSSLSLNAIGESNIRLFSVEEGEDKFRLDLGKEDLLELMNKTAFAMASGDVRYYLNGMLLEFLPSEIRAVSTDAHRLAYARKDSEDDAQGTSEDAPVSCIVPRKAVQELSKLLTGASDRISLRVSDQRMVAEMGDYKLTCRLVDGRYPDYTKVIPKDNQVKAVVDRKALQASMRRAYIVAEDDPGKTVNLHFTSDWLHIQASSPQQHKTNEKIAIQFSGQSEVKIAFNASYMLDYLNSIEHDNIELELKDKESRSLLRGEGETDAFYLLMPVLL